MKKAIALLLVTAAGIGFSAAASAASAEAKAAYASAKEGAASDYKIAREKCNALTDNPKTICIKEAKFGRTHAKSAAEAEYKDTPRAYANARTDIANAELGLAKAKCGSQTGNDKDVCIKEAKAANVIAKADAKADNKIINARIDARDDKNDAVYKVEIEKCDAMAGAGKDSCVAAAKLHFGK